MLMHFLVAAHLTAAPVIPISMGWRDIAIAPGYRPMHDPPSNLVLLLPRPIGVAIWRRLPDAPDLSFLPSVPGMPDMPSFWTLPGVGYLPDIFNAVMPPDWNPFLANPDRFKGESKYLLVCMNTYEEKYKDMKPPNFRADEEKYMLKMIQHVNAILRNPVGYFPDFAAAIEQRDFITLEVAKYQTFVEPSILQVTWRKSDSLDAQRCRKNATEIGHVELPGIHTAAGQGTPRPPAAAPAPYAPPPPATTPQKGPRKLIPDAPGGIY